MVPADVRATDSGVDTTSSRRGGVGIRLDGIQARYARSKFSIDVPALDVSAGEFLTLVGPSGCGKSTTLRVIAGLESPTRGEVYFGERKMTDVPVQRRNIAMVFQDYALYPSMRVRGNLEYGLRKRGVSRDVRDVRVREVAEMLGLQAHLDRRPQELSGGERQRVALGRAIVRSPDVLLMDEPLSSLDAVLRAELRSEIRRIHESIGCTTIYVTHDQLEAMTMSDRIAVMKNGRVEQLDTPEEVYRRPTNLYVGKFIGSPSMNVVPGVVARRPAGIAFVCEAGEVPLGRSRDLDEGRRVLMGVRPHDVRVSLDDGPGDFTMRIDLVQLLGAEKHVELSGKDGVTMAARVDAEARAVAGDTVGCTVATDAVHLFDENTGVRLAG